MYSGSNVHYYWNFNEAVYNFHWMNEYSFKVNFSNIFANSVPSSPLPAVRFLCVIHCNIVNNLCDSLMAWLPSKLNSLGGTYRYRTVRKYLSKKLLKAQTDWPPHSFVGGRRECLFHNPYLITAHTHTHTHTHPHTHTHTHYPPFSWLSPELEYTVWLPY